MRTGYVRNIGIRAKAEVLLLDHHELPSRSNYPVSGLPGDLRADTLTFAIGGGPAVDSEHVFV
jgi:hypothetical protein